MQLNEKLFDAHAEKKSVRDGFGDGLMEAAEKNENIVVLTADLKESTRVHHFAKKYPERFIDVGVAEQNLAAISAGLGLSGKIPVMTSYGVFSPGRNWDQIRVSICYSGSNVKIVSSDAGLATGPDGATHMALEDIAITRVLPNLMVLSPVDYYEAKEMIKAAIKHKGPVYMRVCREKLVPITSEKTKFSLERAAVLKKGSDVTIVGTGPILFEVMRAAEELKDKIDCEVIKVSTIKPLDEKTIIDSAKKTSAVLTIEDHQVTGGLGSAVAELLAQKQPTKMKIMGVKDTFAESGKYAELIQKYGLGSDDIKKELLKLKQN